MKMISKQRIAAIFILLTGFAFALTTVLGEKQQKNSASFVSILPKEKQNSPNLNFKNLNQPTVVAAASQPEEFLDLENGNLTEILARSYVDQIFNQNPEGIQAIDGQTRLKIPSVNTLGSSLNDVLTNPALDFPSFERKDLKLTADNQKSQKFYIESLDNALRKNFSWLKKDILQIIKNFMELGADQDLNRLIDTIPNFINDLLGLPVPDSVSATHIELLNLWQKKLLIYQSLKNKNDDPLKAYLALQKIPEIIQEDINLQSVLMERYKKLAN